MNIDKFPTPACFAKYVSNGKWLMPEHLAYINQELTQGLADKSENIIINMPPRHGKSEFISKYLPAWYLLNNPDKRIILSSYEASFAASWGRKVKEIIDEYGKKLFNIEINPKSSSAKSFAIKGHSGEMHCSGSRGAITGKGADLFLIDDPIKNDIEANSSKIRENVWNWFLSTAFTRLEPDGIMFIIMTRWHEDDLAGRLQRFADEIEGNSFKSIVLPAIADKNDLLGRNEGEPLWKERFSIKKLNSIKKMLGSYWFNALYQQVPFAAEGKIFKSKYFRYFIEDENFYILDFTDSVQRRVFNKNRMSKFSVMDLAARTTQTADYTVALTFTSTPSGEIIILDVVREKFEGADHLKLIKSIYEKHSPVLIGIENTQYQISLIQQARRLGYPVKELKADKDKISRSLPIAAQLESGMVYFRHNAPWLEDFEKELISFPNGKNDDQVDALSYIAVMSAPATNILPISVKRGNKSSSG